MGRGEPPESAIGAVRGGRNPWRARRLLPRDDPREPAGGPLAVLRLRLGSRGPPPPRRGGNAAARGRPRLVPGKGPSVRRGQRLGEECRGGELLAETGLHGIPRAFAPGTVGRRILLPAREAPQDGRRTRGENRA